MKLTLTKDRTSLIEKQKKKYQSLIDLINSLNEKELTEEFVVESNREIALLNEVNTDEKHLKRKIQKTHAKIYSRAVSKLKYTKKNYYTTLWMILGMSAFGLPFGFMFAVLLDNYGFFGLGLPIGMCLGIGIGFDLDKKSQSEGRQLSF